MNIFQTDEINQTDPIEQTDPTNSINTMTASYDLNNLNIPNDDRVTALTHLPIDSFTRSVLSPELIVDQTILTT